MKKRIFALVLIVVILCCLCGCSVNWGGKTYNLPWQLVAVFVVPFSAICFIIGGVHISKKRFVCPKCNKHFKPKWWRCMFSLHFNDNRVLRCPHCNNVGMCSLSYNQD